MARVDSLIALTVFAIGLRASASAQIPAEWMPPPAQAQVWTKCLTPWSKLDLHTPAGPNDSGVTVAEESIVEVDAQGRASGVFQEVFRAVTEDGAQWLGSRTFSYRKHWQKAFILEAESIAPDGSRHPVQPDAILRQAPQRQADASLYDDVEEVKVIFPDVHPGTLIHLVYGIEDVAARFPNEFCTSKTPVDIWPVGLERYRITLPQSMASRLLIDPVGSGLPVPTRRVFGSQVQYEWNWPPRPGRVGEINEPPRSQVGPVIHLTTLHSWDQVGSWFQNLAAGRGQADAVLASAVRSWTAGARTSDERLGLIFRKIADQVRYVGLELDSGDYQPRDCNEVWANQYGDCKDKANLLIAALRVVGQPAYFALLQTEYTGAIDPKTPSYRTFNHVIVAVPKPGGGYVFCDPTLRGAVPGLLSPGDEDRDALLLLPGRSAWVRTPPQDIGAQDISLDLELAPSGTLTGWMDISATGYVGTQFAEAYGALGPTELRRAGGTLVQSFLPSAQALDTARPPYTPGGTFRLRAYVTVDPKGADAQTMVHFPECGQLLVPTGTEATRSTPFHLAVMSERCRITVRLPAGSKPAALPSAYRFQNAACEGLAEWQAHGGVVEGQLQIQLKERVIAPADFALLFEDMRALKGWLGQAVALSHDPNSPPLPTAEGSPLPVLPTGAGELALVDHLYPPSGDVSARRKALQQVQSLFPADIPTLIGARVRLAAADLQEKHFAQSEARIKSLLADYGGLIDHPTLLWAEFLQATALAEMSQQGAAAAIYEKVARDPLATPQYRWISALAVAQFVLASDPRRALSVLTAVDGSTTTATPEMLSYLLHAQMIVGADDGYLDRFLTRLHGGTSESTEDNWTRLLRTCAGSWLQADDADRLARVAGAIRRQEVVIASADLRAQLAFAEHRAAVERIQGHLRMLLLGPLAAWYFPDRTAKPEAFADIDQQLAADDRARDPVHAVRLSVTSLLWNDPPNFSFRLWHAAAYADWAERLHPGSIPGAVTAALLDLCDQLPHDDVQWVEARLLRGQRDARLGFRDAARSELTPLLDSPVALPAQRAAILFRLGQNDERAGQWAAAARDFERAEPYLTAAHWGGDGLVRAILIHLRRHETAAARADIRTLGQLDEAGFKTLSYGKMARQLVELERTGQPEIYWAGSDVWWPLWLKLAHLAGLKGDAADVPVPSLGDRHDFNQYFIQAMKRGDPGAAWADVAWCVSAARWLPSENEAAARMLSTLTKDFPAYAPQVRSWLIALTAAPLPAGYPETGWRQLVHAAAQIESGQTEAALATIRQYESHETGREGEVNVRVHLLHARLGTQARDRQEAAAALTRDLAGNETGFYRFQAVEALANLDHDRGDFTAESNLLDGELSRGHWSSAERQRLEARRNGLRGGATLSAAVQRWIDKAGASWYPDAAPQRTPDQSFADVGSLLAAANKLPPARQPKFLLLAAQNDALPLEVRAEAWMHAGLDMQFFAGRFSDRERIVDTFLEQREVPTGMRRFWLETSLVYSVLDGRHAFVEKLRGLPLAASLSPAFSHRLDAFRSLRPGDASSIAATVRKLASQPLDSPAAIWIGHLAEKLGDLGDSRDLDALAAAAPGWKWTDQAVADNLSVGLLIKIQQDLQRAQRFGPASRAMFAVLRRHFPASSFYDPSFADWRQSGNYPGGPSSEMLRAGLFFAQRDGLWAGRGQACLLLFRGLESRADGAAIIGELLRAGFGQIKDDESGTEIARTLGGAIDFDEPGQLAAFTAAASVVNPDWPNVADSVHLIQANGHFREGGRVTPPRLLQGSDPYNAAFAAGLRLEILRVRGDLGGLASELDSSDPDVLFEQVGDAIMLRCLRALGRTSEWNIAAARARRRLADVTTMSWMTQDQTSVDDIVRTLDALGDPKLVNDRWVDDMTVRMGSSSMQSLGLQILRAKLRSDWAGLIRVSAPLNTTYSTLYDFCFDRAVALHALHRDAEAVPLLATYCRYVNDSDNHRAAVTLLRKLAPDSNALSANRGVPFGEKAQP